MSLDISDYVGKRCLLKIGQGWKSNVDECRILEVASSGNWVKVQNLYGNKFWRNIAEVSFVEELRDLRAERRELG